MADQKIPGGVRWIILAVLLVGSLVVGSGVLDQHPQTRAERITALEESLKCPSCQDLSVAQSTSPSSLAVRAEIVKSVDAGLSNDEIVAALRSRYGTAVDLTPSGSLSVVLWIVPAAFAVGVMIAIVIAARRRQRLDDDV